MAIHDNCRADCNLHRIHGEDGRIQGVIYKKYTPIIMDFFAHLLWSGIIFTGPQIFLACFCGVLPDLAAFLPTIFRRGSWGRDWRTPDGRQAFIQSPEYQKNLTWYSWTHSLVVWGIAIGIGTAIWSIAGGDYPWFLFAGVIHILIDIPTHSRAFFAPAFLIPISKYRVNGFPWANRVFMVVNYALIVTALLVRLFQYHVI